MTDSARPFGVWTASALVVGGMIGAGIFVLPAQLAPYGWTGFVAWGFAIPGALLLAYVMARLAAARPETGGAIAIVGEALGTLPGLLIGWSYWVGICSFNAILALTAVRYGAAFAPAMTGSPLATSFWASALIWALTLINLGGAKGAGRFQLVTTVLKLLPLIAVVMIVAWLSVAEPARAAPALPVRFAAAELSTALTLTFSSLLGFEAASLATERLRDPARNIIRATLYGTMLTGLLYVIVCNGVVFALPAATVAASDAPIALFVETFWGRGASLAIAAFAAIAAIGCLNGWTFMQAEIPFVMARNGLMPTFLASASSREVPTAAMLISSSFASGLVLAGAIPGMPNVLKFMLQLTTAATVWLYVGVCAAALAIEIVRPAALIGLAFSLWLLWGSGLEALGLSTVLMLTALPLYWLRPGDRVQLNKSDTSAV